MADLDITPSDNRRTERNHLIVVRFIILALAFIALSIFANAPIG